MKCNFSYAKEVIFFVPETDDKVWANDWVHSQS